MIEIRCESCFDFLPTIEDSSIDLVLIDPPYEISRETGFNHGDLTGRDTDRFRVSMEFGDWDSQFQNLDLVVAECFRILRSGGSMICFYDLWKISTLKEYFDRAGFKQIRFIEWLKTNPVPLNSKRNYLTNAREIAVTGTKNGKPTFNSEYDSGVYRFPICHSKDRFHPTQKPLELIEELIRKHSNAGDLILDCFLGSGTTAIASKNLGRNFIGCEIDPNFYKKILERLQSFEGILSS
ncbi:MAG: site-specific DNA-methyltransferase [Selenomonadaceae bacterium]|nr:site-specific DNA-methyltransferase [Selenomonadaceae bacterium]